MPDTPSPAYRVLDTVSEQIAATDMLLGLAQGIVRVFDTNLAQTGWDRAARAENLARFLLHSRDARLQIIVHDTRYLESSGARIVALLRRFGSAITIYRTGIEARGANDPLLVVDDRHFLHRFHADQPRAALVIDDPAQTKTLVSRFEDIWITGEPGLAGDVLGL